jgi:hypothetical protein
MDRIQNVLKQIKHGAGKIRMLLVITLDQVLMVLVITLEQVSMILVTALRVFVDELLCHELTTGPEKSATVYDTCISPAKPTYLISSLLIHDCYQRLVKANPKRWVERMCYATGVFTENQYVLTKILQPEFARQSSVGVRAEDNSSQRIFLMLEKYSHGLYAWFHTHPGVGRGSTIPSPTDHHTKERLRLGGYHAIGGIFSMDGYLRFFGSGEFEIAVFGKGVKKVNEYLFRLENGEEL